MIPLPTSEETARLIEESKSLTSLLASGPTAITADFQFRAACLFRRSIQTLRKRIADTYKPVKQERFQAHREATGAEKVLLEPVNELTQALDAMLLDYVDRKRALMEDIGLADADEEDDEAAFSTAASSDGQPPRIRGISVKEKWVGEVTDLESLVKAAARGEVPLRWLMPNRAEIDEAAESYQERMREFEDSAGLTSKRERSIIARAFSAKEGNAGRKV